MRNIFSKMDKIEKQIGKPVDKMNDTEFIDYIYKMYELVYGFKYKGDFVKVPGIVKKFRTTYNRENAGKMIKYVFIIANGQLRGEQFTFPGICSKMEWRNNQILADVKRYEGEWAPSSTRVAEVPDDMLTASNMSW